MNNSIQKLLITSFYLIVLTVVLTGGGVITNAQSTDRDHPTPLTTSEIRISGKPRAGKYFYTFTAGPGEVKAVVDGQTSNDVQILYFGFADTDYETIFGTGSNYLPANANQGGSRQVHKINLKRKMTLIFQYHFDESQIKQVRSVDFRIRFEGALALPAPANDTPIAQDVNSARRQGNRVNRNIVPSEDENAPTPLTVNRVRAKVNIPGGQYGYHYYSLTAGPGRVRVTVIATPVERGANISVYFAGKKCCNNADIVFMTGGTEPMRQVKSFEVPALGKLNMKVQFVGEFTYDILLEGAVALEEAAYSPSPSENNPLSNSAKKVDIDDAVNKARRVGSLIRRP